MPVRCLREVNSQREGGWGRTPQSILAFLRWTSEQSSTFSRSAYIEDFNRIGESTEHTEKGVNTEGAG